MALDQSPNHTGFCIAKPMEQKPVFGKFALPSWGKEEPDRVFRFWTWLNVMIVKYGVTHLFYEKDVPSSGLGKGKIVTPQRGKYAGQTRAIVVNGKDPSITLHQNILIGLIWLAGRVMNVKVNPIDVNMMRDHFIGCRSVVGLQGDAHRNELKSLAVKKCAMLGLLVEDDNVAEAIGHWDYGLSCIHVSHGQNPLILSRRNQIGIWAGGAA